MFLTSSGTHIGRFMTTLALWDWSREARDGSCPYRDHGPLRHPLRGHCDLVAVDWWRPQRKTTPSLSTLARILAVRCRAGPRPLRVSAKCANVPQETRDLRGLDRRRPRMEVMPLQTTARITSRTSSLSDLGIVHMLCASHGLFGLILNDLGD